MPFDLSTAKPDTGGGFDLSTAKPVQDPVQGTTEPSQEDLAKQADIPRQLGIGTRDVLKSIGSTVGIAYDPIASLFNAAGAHIPTAQARAEQLADVVGLPKPETNKEQLYSDLRPAAELLMGGGGKSIAGAVKEAAPLVKQAAGAPGRAIGRIKDGLTFDKPNQAAEGLRSTVQEAQGAARGRAGAEKWNLQGQQGALEVQAREQAAQVADLDKRASELKLAARQARSVRENITARSQAADLTAQRHAVALGAPATEEQVGSLIQQAGQRNLERIAADTREEAITKIKDPAFEESRARHAAGDTMMSNPVSAQALTQAESALKQIVEDTPAATRPANYQKILGTLLGEERPLTPAEMKVEESKAFAAKVQGQQYDMKESVREPLTLHQAEYLRRWLNKPNEQEKLGFVSLDAARMREISEKLTEAMKAYEPRVGQYLERYRAGKEAEATALGGTRGAGATKTVKGAEDVFAKDPKAVASGYLNGTADGAKRLVALVGGKSPELTQSVKGFVRFKVENMTGEQARKWVALNKPMLNEFPEALKGAQEFVKAKLDAERLSKLVKPAEQAAQKNVAASESTVSEARATERAQAGTEKKAATVGEQIAAKAKAQRSVYIAESEVRRAAPDKLAEVANTQLKRLHDEGIIEQGEYDRLTAEVDRIGAQYKRIADRRNRIQSLMKSAIIAGSGYTAYQAAKGFGLVN